MGENPYYQERKEKEKSGDPMDRFHGRDQKIKGTVSRQLAKNIVLLKEIFKNCNDLVQKEFTCGTERNVNAFILYTDGMAKTEMIEESILRPLLNREIPQMEGNPEAKGKRLCEFVQKEVLEMADMKELTAMEDVVTQILAGNTVLLLDGSSTAIMISSKMFPTRGFKLQTGKLP